MAKRYIVTSLQKGSLVHKNFFDNVLLFCENKKIDKIYCFVMNGRNIYEEMIDPRIASHPLVEIVYKYEKLNENLMLSDSQIRAQAVDPFLGLKGKLPREYSHIVPGTKVRLESIATLSKYPRLLISTGALTQPYYHDHTYERPKQNGVKARLQHQQGFTYIEVLNSKRFRTKAVTAQNSGNFYFDRDFYKNQKVINTDIASISFGDLHNEHTYKPALTESLKRVKYLKPKEVQLHDSFDGISVNHWERNKLSKMIKLQSSKNVSIEHEVSQLHKTLTELAECFPDTRWNIVYSNHDERLQNYVDGKTWVDDYRNTLFAAKMLDLICKGESIALRGALKLIGALPKNVNFFELDSEYRIRGVLVSAHGHKGISGSRGSPKSFSGYNMRACTGHTHSPQLNENGAVSGTLEAPQGYTKGSPNNWLYANTIIYQDGSMTIDILDSNFK